MKTVFITGGSSGIGQAIVGLLKENGWEVIAPTRKELDLSDLQNVSKITQKLTNEHSKIDALIHVAGIWHDKSNVYANKDLEDFTDEQISSTIAVGLTSFMIMAAKLLPKMPKSGKIIAVSGTFNDGAGGWLPYYTSKRALEDFLVGLSQDYPSGPQVYGISPADTATKAFTKFYPEYVAEAQPPQAISNLCLDLIKGEEDHKTGSIIQIRDGKRSSGYHV